MATTAGAVKVLARGGTLTVTLTSPGGLTPTVYSDESGTATVSLPATVTAGNSVTLYVPAAGTYTLSVKTTGGLQIAGPGNATRSVTLSAGVLQPFDYDATLPEDVNSDSVSSSGTGEGSGTYLTPAQASSTYAPLVATKFRTAEARARRNNSIELGVMTTPPAITSATSNLDATLTKAYRTSTGQAGSFRVTGGTPTQGTSAFAPYRRAPVITMPSGSGGNTSGDGTTNTYQWAWEFVSDAPKVMLRLLNATTTFMVEVDDQPVSASTLAYPSTSGTGYILLDFTSAGGSAVRRFRVEMTQASAFDGVYVGPTYSIWPPVSDTNLVVATVGDSIDTGTNALFPNGSWQKVAGKLLGWTDVRQVSFGGTGFVAVGSYNTFGAALRVADVVAANPNLLVISATQNDDAQAGVQASALAAFQAYRTALPNTPIVVMGADAGSSGPSANRLANEASVLAAFTQWADSRSWFIPVSNDSTGSWEYGTGTTGSPAGSGNRDRFGSDNSHPNDLGHKFLAYRFANAFRSLVLPNL